MVSIKSLFGGLGVALLAVGSVSAQSPKEVSTLIERLKKEPIDYVMGSNDEVGTMYGAHIGPLTTDAGTYNDVRVAYVEYRDGSGELRVVGSSQHDDGFDLQFVSDGYGSDDMDGTPHGSLKRSYSIHELMRTMGTSKGRDSFGHSVLLLNRVTYSDKCLFSGALLKASEVLNTEDDTKKEALKR